jgi:multiple sugar transport system ATP-binding protein
MVEPLGDQVVVHGRLGDDMLVFKVDPHKSPAFGVKVPVWVQVDSIHLFDAATELRIV